MTDYAGGGYVGDAPIPNLARCSYLEAQVTARATPRRYVAADFAPDITERQADMLLRAILGETRWGSGFGPLGVDLRTYGPLIDRGLLEEVAVDRGWGLGRGAIACATSAGRIALVRHLRDCDHGDIAHEWLIEWVGAE